MHVFSASRGNLSKRKLANGIYKIIIRFINNTYLELNCWDKFTCCDATWQPVDPIRQWRLAVQLIFTRACDPWCDPRFESRDQNSPQSCGDYFEHVTRSAYLYVSSMEPIVSAVHTREFDFIDLLISFRSIK